MRVKVLAIEPGGQTRNAALLDAMHRHRHRLFVEALGWAALAAPDGRERDAFDGPDAIYLIAQDEGGALCGSIRLLPTDRPHMLTGPFAAWVEGEPPCGPTILEWTRHAPGLPEWPPAVNEGARLALHLAALEYAALRGVTAYTALLETWLVRRARALGWACAPLGPSRRYGEGEAVAVHNPVRAGHLATLRAKVGVTRPVLIVDAAAAA